MKHELQESLFKAYPKIFARRHMSKEYTSMCYGIQCPDKWYDLIDNRRVLKDYLRYQLGK